jgi:hypothetical protein
LALSWARRPASTSTVGGEAAAMAMVIGDEEVLGEEKVHFEPTKWQNRQK